MENLIWVRVLLTAGSMFVVDLFGRRPLLLASGLVMSASTAAVGAFFAIDPEKRVDIPGPIQYSQLHTSKLP